MPNVNKCHNLHLQNVSLIDLFLEMLIKNVLCYLSKINPWLIINIVMIWCDVLSGCHRWRDPPGLPDADGSPRSHCGLPRLPTFTLSPPISSSLYSPSGHLGCPAAVPSQDGRLLTTTTMLYVVWCCFLARSLLKTWLLIRMRLYLLQFILIRDGR